MNFDRHASHFAVCFLIHYLLLRKTMFAVVVAHYEGGMGITEHTMHNHRRELMRNFFFVIITISILQISSDANYPTLYNFFSALLWFSLVRLLLRIFRSSTRVSHVRCGASFVAKLKFYRRQYNVSSIS